jgi:ankyrin repeat protein
VNAQDRFGATPLMWAAWNNPNPEVISTLLNMNADARVHDKDGRTAYDWAQNNSTLNGAAALQQLRAATR